MSTVARDFSKVGCVTLREAIDGLLKSVGDWPNYEEVGKTPRELLDEIKAAVLAKKLTDAVFSGQSARILFEPESRAEICLLVALHYAALADIAEQENDSPAGWPYLMEAMRHFGRAEGVAGERISFTRSSNARSEGGLATADVRSGLARKELEKLIETKRPDGGWLSEKELIEKLEVPLNRFIEDEGLELKTENTPRNIKNWLKNDKAVRDKFERFRKNG